jgi:hypothetical protein
MRIIKDTLHDLEAIVGEMINITYGMTIYENSKLLENFKKNHNEYVINDVSYNIHPNIGMVFLLSNIDIDITAIVSTFNYMTTAIRNKIDTLNLEVGSVDNRNNLLIVDSYKNPYSYISIEYNKVLTKSINLLTNKFTWYVFNKEYINNLPIIGWNAAESNYNIYSLSSIIYDGINCFKFKNGYKSPDYPSVRDCYIYDKGFIYDKVIQFNVDSGPLLEIANYYNKLNKNIRYNNKIKDHNLYYAMWEQLIIYENTNSLVPWYKQIKLGLLDGIRDNNKTINEYTINNKIYKCFITGIPIYEDCYVFDVVSIIIEKIVHVNDLVNYSKYKVISNVVTQDEINELKYSNTTYTEITDIKADTKAGAKAGAKAKKIKKNSKLINDNKTDNEIDNKDNKTDNETRHYVKINYQHVFTTPKCLLISTFYVHFSNHNLYPFDPIKYFEKLTQTKILVYRSYCPTKIQQVIESLDTTPLHKKILNELNEQITYSNGNYSTKSFRINLHKLETSNLLLPLTNINNLSGKEYRY